MDHHTSQGAFFVMTIMQILSYRPSSVGDVVVNLQGYVYGVRSN
jgi:hypothetical protein